MLTLNLEQIQEYEQNRFPYLMIDRVTSLVPGEYADGFKNLTSNEWFFPVHFKDNANMPGMLQIESMVQMAALSILTLPDNKGKVMYLTSLEKAWFKRKIVPGDRFDIETKVIQWKRGQGKFEGIGFVEGKIACCASFFLVLPDELEKYKVKGK